MAQKLTYAEVVRQRMKTTDNPSRSPVSMRDLSKAVDYSYEHVRKMVAGEPVVSRAFNDAVCQYLGLDAEKMWELARYEKLTRKFTGVQMPIALPPDVFFKDAWPKLTSEQKANLRKVVEAYLIQNAAAESQSAYYSQ